jgi:hypothetical protein
VPYAPNQEIRVAFTGTVESVAGNKSSTSKIRDEDGYLHFIYLGSTRALKEAIKDYDNSGPVPVDATVTIAFNARVSATQDDRPPGTTVISGPKSRGPFTYTHYLNLASPAVTTIAGEVKAEKKAYPPGQDLRIEFRGTVLTNDSNFGSTTQVAEDGTGIVHYLYLGGNLNRTALLGAAMVPAPGSKVTVAFTATVTRSELEPAGTTPVTADGFMYAHYLDTASPAITAIPGEVKAEKKVYPPGQDLPDAVPARVTPMPGQKVRVEFSGEVLTVCTGPSLTSQVREDGTGIIHYLYLTGFSKVRASGENEVGSKVTIAFTAKIDKENLDRSPAGTRSVRDDSSRGYIHFLDISSPSVVVTGPDTAAVITGSPPPGKRITSTDDEISSRAVVERITALQLRAPKPQVRVTRNRSNEVMGTFASTAIALAYLEDNDLLATRFTSNRIPGELPAEDAAELASLSDFCTRGRVIFGTLAWDGLPGVTLRPASYYNEDWARGLAATLLLLRDAQVSKWPFTCTDWSRAASDKRNRDYEAVVFDTVRFLGKRPG